MDIKKAIITAAGQTQRTLPLQSLVDRDGVTKTALQIIIEEILQAGVEEICAIVCPGDQAAYTTAAGAHAKRIQFIEQSARLRSRGALRPGVRGQESVPAPRRRSSLP